MSRCRSGRAAGCRSTGRRSGRRSGAVSGRRRWWPRPRGRGGDQGGAEGDQPGGDGGSQASSGTSHTCSSVGGKEPVTGRVLAGLPLSKMSDRHFLSWVGPFARGAENALPSHARAGDARRHVPQPRASTVIVHLPASAPPGRLRPLLRRPAHRDSPQGRPARAVARPPHGYPLRGGPAVHGARGERRPAHRSRGLRGVAPVSDHLGRLVRTRDGRAYRRAATTL